MATPSPSGRDSTSWRDEVPQVPLESLQAGASEILQRVLAQTRLDEASASSNQKTQRVASGIQAICRRHASLSWCVQPVATELVELVLRESWPNMCPSDHDWKSLGTLIAESLADSPEVWSRLESLWSSWREAV